MTANSVQKKTVCVLSCRHQMNFYDSPPKVGDPITCRLCGKAVIVLQSGGKEWEVKCVHPGCDWLVAVGGQLAGETKAAGHRRTIRGRGHEVVITNPKGEEKKRYRNIDQPVLLGNDDPGY